MTKEETALKETFASQMELLFQEVGNRGMLKKLRSSAWDSFQSLGLPTKNNEVYKYIRLKKLFSHKYCFAKESSISSEHVLKHVYPECQGAFLVFVNGRYSEALSCRDLIAKNVVIEPLEKAYRTYGAFLNNHFSSSLKQEKDSFALLNAAVQQDGLFIYVPPKTVVETPVQILHFIDTSKEDEMLVPRMQVFVGKGSEIQIYSSAKVLSAESYGVNQCTDFALDENAHVRYYQCVMKQKKACWYFDALRASLKRDSQFHAVNFNDGTETYRSDYHVSLTQENASCSLEGVWMLKDQKQSHTNIFIDHQAPYCTSRQLFKGVLLDASQSSFEGKILVRPQAQKTDAFQLNNNLLLGEHSMADSKPNLEIFADDVKASHGATVGRLDQEQLFYLKSRGIYDEEAKNILIYGYCKEIVDQIQLPSLLETLKSEVKSFTQCIPAPV